MNEDLESFRPYLKAFATGPKGNRDLSFDESYEACKLILEQKIPPEVIGAFLMTWRVKIETDDELKGAFKALHSQKLVSSNVSNSIEIAFSLNGKKKNIPLILLTAKYLPDENFVITTSSQGDKKEKNSLDNLKPYLGKNILLRDTKDYLPQLEALHKLRENLGQRSIFNTLEKLTNPLNSDYAIIGAHHGPYFKKYAKLFSSEYKRMMIVQGDEGCGEIIKKSKIEIIENGEISEAFSINPSDYEIEFKKSDENLSLEEVKQQLEHPSQDLIKLAKLNAALYSYLKNTDVSIKEYYSRF